MEDFELFYKHFNEFLKAFNQKGSEIKEQILRVLFASKSHLNAQEICQKIYENKSVKERLENSINVKHGF